ncbi:MAG TPA: C1 family peptidase [Bacteroidia bacterium]|nr:C1 family peptidase [Bacteroidia bacterium]
MSLIKHIIDYFHPKLNKYGWRPQHPDIRDHQFTLENQPPLPISVDLRPQDTPIYDQGELGSCTGNAISGAIAFDLKKQKIGLFVPSRLYIYYNEREREGTVNQDAGAIIRDGIKTIASNGACDENVWPYDISKFNVKPSAAAYASGHKTKGVKYAAVNQDVNSIKQTLAAGYPIVFGFTAYPEFELPGVAQTGVLPMPTGNEAPVGGHAVIAVGYHQDYITVRNSWGVNWGDKGYFYMPVAYITNPNLASDLWVIEVVS